MYRSFVRIKALVRNRAYPEGSIAEGYIADECLTYCSRFLDETTRFTRPPRNPDPSDNTKDLYMFESAGEPIGKAITVARFDNQFLVQAHRYVLRHCDELEDFRKCVTQAYSLFLYCYAKIDCLIYVIVAENFSMKRKENCLIQLA